MKETRNINLHGVVLTIDEDAYQVLKTYLADIEDRLPADEKSDVMDDVESRIAELLQSALFARSAQSVTIAMIEDVKRRIGAPSEFGENKRPEMPRERFNRQSVGRVLTIVLKVILIIIAIQLIFPVLAALFGLLLAFLGISFGGLALLPAVGFEMVGGSPAWTWVLCLSVLAVVAVPVYTIVYWIVKWSRERKHPSLQFWTVTLLIWLLSIGGLVASACKVLQVNGGEITSLMHELDEWDDEDGRTSRVIDLDTFEGIEASNAVSIEVKAGEAQHVIVRARDVNSVTAAVEDGVLKIANRGDNNHTEVEIHVPTLRQLNLSGASRAEVEGKTDELTANISGASNLKASDLTVQNLHLNVSGASKAEVTVTDSLWAQASGASKIKYHGNPSLRKSISIGASSIRKD